MTAISPIGFAMEASIPGGASLGIEKESPMAFGDLLMTGVSALEKNVDAASSALASYAVNGDVSPHELMLAMEHAKLSMQFAVGLRNHVVEAYQELARMQV